MLCEKVLQKLTHRYGNIWQVSKSKGYLIVRIDSNKVKKICELLNIKNLILPIDKVVTVKYHFIMLKNFYYSFKKYFEFLEPSDLREIEKKIPSPHGVEFESLVEKTVTYLSSDARWSKAMKVSAIKDFILCMNLAKELFSNLSITYNLSFSFIGLYEDYYDLVRVLRTYKVSELSFMCLFKRRIGNVFLGVVARGRLVEKINNYLKLFEDFCRNVISNENLRKLSWLIFGFSPKSLRDLEELWYNIRKFSQRA